MVQKKRKSLLRTVQLNMRISPNTMHSLNKLCRLESASQASVITSLVELVTDQVPKKKKGGKK